MWSCHFHFTLIKEKRLEAASTLTPYGLRTKWEGTITPEMCGGDGDESGGERKGAKEVSTHSDMKTATRSTTP